MNNLNGKFEIFTIFKCIPIFIPIFFGKYSDLKCLGFGLKLFTIGIGNTIPTSRATNGELVFCVNFCMVTHEGVCWIIESHLGDNKVIHNICGRVTSNIFKTFYYKIQHLVIGDFVQKKKKSNRWLSWQWCWWYEMLVIKHDLY